MKKILLFSVIFAIVGLVNGQSLKSNKQMDRLGFKRDISLAHNVLMGNRLSEMHTSNVQISENAPGRDFFRKEMMKQGTIKSGTAIGSSARLVFGAETTLSDSEVVNTTIPFIKSTQTPFVNLELEYMITDQLAVGVLGGFTKSSSSNRNSDGVSTKTDVNGIILGGNFAMYRPLTSWLYLPLYAEFIYSKGTLKESDGLEKLDYEYQSMRPSLGTGISLVFSEFIQLDLRGIDISYSTIEFIQTGKIDSNGNIQRGDQKNEIKNIELASNPRIRILFHMFRVGGGYSNR
jgi:hypothetical protein